MGDELKITVSLTGPLARFVVWMQQRQKAQSGTEPPLAQVVRGVLNLYMGVYSDNKFKGKPPWKEAS